VHFSQNPTLPLAQVLEITAILIFHPSPPRKHNIISKIPPEIV